MPSWGLSNNTDAGKNAIIAMGITAVINICTPFVKIDLGYNPKKVTALKISHTRLLPTHLNRVPDRINAKEKITQSAETKRRPNWIHWANSGGGRCLITSKNNPIPPINFPNSSMSIPVTIDIKSTERGLISNRSNVPSRIRRRIFQTIPNKKGNAIPLTTRNMR